MDGQTTHKRPRIESSAPANTSSYSYLSRLCLIREDIQKYARCLFFDKIARGHYIRATVSGGDGIPTPRLLLIRSISTLTSNYILTVKDIDKGIDIQLPVTSVSNSLPTEKETDQLAQSIHRVQEKQSTRQTHTHSIHTLVPTQEEVNKAFELRLRIIQDINEGKACAAPSSLKVGAPLTIWGGERSNCSDKGQTSIGEQSPSTTTVQVQHEALVVFRSWLLQDILLEQDAKSKKDNILDPSSNDISKQSDLSLNHLGDDTWAKDGPLLLQPCIADGRGVDAHTGVSGGQCGTMQRAGGQFAYLFLHRMFLEDTKLCHNQDIENGKKTTTNVGFFEPFSTVPAIYDEHQPDITAWRAARKFIDNSISLELFRASIIAQIDNVNINNNNNSNTLSTSSHSKTSSEIFTSEPSIIQNRDSLLTSAGFNVRCLESSVQLFLVDIDSIARQLGQQTKSSSSHITSNSFKDPHIDDIDFFSKKWLSKIIGNVIDNNRDMSSTITETLSATKTTKTLSSSTLVSNLSISNDQIREMFIRSQKEFVEEGKGKEGDSASLLLSSSISTVPPSYFYPEGKISSGSSTMTSSVNGVMSAGSVVSVQKFNNGIAVLSETQLEAALGFEQSSEKVYINGTWSDIGHISLGENEHCFLRKFFTACYGSLSSSSISSSTSLINQAHMTTVDIEIENSIDPGVYSDSVYASLHLPQFDKRKHITTTNSSYVPSWPIFSSLLLPSSSSSNTLTLPHGPLWVPQLFPRRFKNEHCVILFHGTSLSMAHSILQKGFFRARCRMAEACHDGSCSCNMLGFGVYFGDKSKAYHFATRRAIFDIKTGKNIAAIVKVKVDLGLVKVSSGPCPCGRKGGCLAPFVDHWGNYYSKEGFDSLYLRSGSSGAANQREWAISDPARCFVLGIEEVQF